LKFTYLVIQSFVGLLNLFLGWWFTYYQKFGGTLKRLDNAVKVLRSLIASVATLALNLAEYLLRLSMLTCFAPRKDANYF